ncbi:hypothetical protein BGZ57DRAFT_752763, partial [Hyaloscypha finlandica]
SRPPPVRTHYAGSSPPPLSPRIHSEKEKRHHSRRKSGREYVVVTEKKPSSRPAPLPHRSTPQSVAKGGRGWSSSGRNRSGRDSGESFPQYCMTCEKQFLPANNTYLYCSEPCRLHDQAPPQPLRMNSYPASYTPSSPPLTPYTRQYTSGSAAATPSHEEGPDIIPRFSPTQSRPRSYFNSDPYPQSYQAPAYSASPPQAYANSGSSTALASLRELATALPRTSSSRREPESPPKSSASSINRTGSGVWNYIPFAGSKAATPTPSATPGNSYTNGSHTYTTSQSYGGGYYATNGYAGRSREDLYSYGKSHGTAVGGYGSTGGMGMDRPLPPRSGPSGYGHRPKSIDLVTPFSNHH